MRTLRATDGTEPHLRALRYHMRRCREKQKDPLFAMLFTEAKKAYDALSQKALEVEEANESVLDIMADVDGTEAEFEDEVRNTSDDLSKLDRKFPELNLYQKIFPRGISKVIQAERRSQVTPANELLDRMSPHLSHPGVSELYAKLKTSLLAFEQALEARENEEKRHQALFTQEQSLRGSAREQLTSALARLTDRYKANPALAENFFLDDPRTGSSALSQAENRGRLNGKIEVLLSFFEKKQLSPSESKKSGLLTLVEEGTLDQWLLKAFEGGSLEEILANIPEPSKEADDAGKTE